MSFQISQFFSAIVLSENFPAYSNMFFECLTLFNLVSLLKASNLYFRKLQLR